MFENRRRTITQERGPEFEDDIFGHPIGQLPFENRHYTADEAIKLAISFLSGEPITELGTKLRDAIAVQMKEFTDVKENIELISTLGTPVDIGCGVDGIVHFDGIYVTLDASLRDKHGEQKADRVIGPRDFDNDRSIALLASEIASLLKSRLKNKR